MRPPFKHPFVPYLTTLTGSLLIAGSVLSYRAADRAESPLPTSAQQDQIASAGAAASHGASVTDRLIDSLTGGPVSADFTAFVEELPIDELYQISEGWAVFHERSPEEAERWLQDLVNQLTERDAHERALDVMGYLPMHVSIPQMERGVVNDWLTTDEEQLRTFITSAAEDSTLDEHHASLLASILLHEGSEKLDTWQRWVQDQKGPRGLELQAVMVSKLAHHAEEEQREQVAKLFEANLDNHLVVNQLPKFASQMGQEDPAGALDWVAGLEMQDEVMRAETFGRILYETAQSDPDKAWKLLSADDFLARVYQDEAAGEGGEWGEVPQQFFDMTLTSYINGMVLTDPQSAIASTESFFNKETGARVRQEIQAYVDHHLARLNEGRPTGHHHAPGEDCAICDHDGDH